jgi:hypothetical protein
VSVCLHWPVASSTASSGADASWSAPSAPATPPRGGPLDPRRPQPCRRPPPTAQVSPGQVRRGAGQDRAGEARFSEDRLGEAGSVKPRRTEAKAPGRQPPATAGRSGRGRGCRRRCESHGHTTAQANAVVTSPPAGDSNVRRTIVRIEVPIVHSFGDAESCTPRVADDRQRHQDQWSRPGPVVGPAPGSGEGTTSTGRSVNSSTCAVSLPTYGSPARRGPGDHREVGGPDLGLAEDAPRR